MSKIRSQNGRWDIRRDLISFYPEIRRLIAGTVRPSEIVFPTRFQKM
ncbi:hypothetical protein [Neglecta timonensis]